MNARQKPEANANPDLPDLSERPSFFGTRVIYPARATTEADFLDLGRMGYSSNGTKMTRDEMHER